VKTRSSFKNKDQEYVIIRKIRRNLEECKDLYDKELKKMFYKKDVKLKQIRSLKDVIMEKDQESLYVSWRIFDGDVYCEGLKL